ncbi:MAG: MHYT domain-containing protein [Pseudomonadota bacterium]
MHLEVTHDIWLVAASLAVAMMAGFTGLSLTRGASELSVEKRKLTIVLAAIALGGGIWSMHFVAMLGLQLPIAFYYDPLITLISALIAVIVVGIALLLLHFWPRSNVTITIAGTLVGIGILAMHYIGMSGMQLCLPLYTPLGVGVSILASIVLSVAAFWIAYGERTHRRIVLGTLFFGCAVFAVHFVAVAGTSFVAADSVVEQVALIGNDTLAFVVTIGSFVILGAFLLSSVTFVTESVSGTDADRGSADSEANHAVGDEPRLHPIQLAHVPQQIPFERNGRTYFIDSAEVAAIRAEGHYTYLYNKTDKLFCPWSISEAQKRLPLSDFVRTHRSYLVNPQHVSSFERTKDNGVCYFDGSGALEKVPVSRSRLPAVRESLGLT